MNPKDFKGKMVMVPRTQYSSGHVAYCMHVDNERYHLIDWNGNGEHLRIESVTLREATTQEIADAAIKDCRLNASEYDFV